MTAQVNVIEEQSKMYLVLMDTDAEIDLSMCYSKRFDKELVKIEFMYEDSINQLDDLGYVEEALGGPECFVPEIKLVYKYHTYVISLYCSKVVKYKNQTPWFTSGSRLKNDLFLTPTVYNYLNRLRIQHFGPDAANAELSKTVSASAPLQEMTDYNGELEWLLNEEGLEEEDADDLEFKEERVLPDEDDDLGELDDDGGQ